MASKTNALGLTTGETIMGALGLGLIATIFYAIYEVQQASDAATGAASDVQDALSNAQENASGTIQEYSNQVQGGLSDVVQTGQNVQSQVAAAQVQATPLTNLAQALGF